MATAEQAAERMAQAALELAVERGWRTLSLGEVAARAELPLVDAYRAAPDKAALLVWMIGATDRAVLEGGMADAADAPRDRLFDVLMRRFDALQARRAGVVAVLRDLPGDPVSTLCALPRLARALAWMLEAAGISSAGLVGSLRIKALGVVYLSALQAWMDDETADMARTMSALDKGLRRLERLARSLPAAMRAPPARDDKPFAPPPPDQPPSAAPTGA
jgi:AcrR family transcriptional regulator